MRLLDCCKIDNQSVSKYEGTKKYIATGDIINNNIVTYEEYYYDSKPSRANLQIEEGTVIFAKMKDTIKVLIGNKDNKNNIYSTGFCSLIPNDNILSKYLFYYLNSESFNKQKNKYSSGATQQAINNEKLKKIMIKELPTLEKQKEIIKKLDTITSLIEYKKIQIDKLNELIKSQFVEMFGNPVVNEKKWDKRRLFDECEIITGNTPPRKIASYYGDYIEWIKSDNILENNMFLTRAKEFLSPEGLTVGRSIDKECILMTCIAGSLKSIGNVGITDRKVSFNQQINGINPKENNVYFMYVQFVLSKDYLHTPINMSLKGILSKNQLGNLEFIFPPIDLQNKFADIVKQIDKQKFEFENSLKKLEELKNSLMQEYFG